jgi:hypothetical protein
LSDDTIGAAVWNLQLVGGVADVTATAPMSSSGGTNPDLSITQADGTTDGYLSQTDWNTFDGKFDVPTGTITEYLDGLGTPTPFPTIPTLTSDLTNDGADGINPFITALDLPTNGLPVGGTAGQILTKIDATNYNATWQDNYADWTSVVKHIVKNDGTGLITKGTAVYVTGSNGTNMLVGKASNTSEATSSKTMGLMQSDITTTGGTQTGFVITEGLIANLNTAGTTAGDPVWLGVNGALIYGLINKPYAPAHLVFIGIVTKVSAGNGEIFVKVQNGFELKEIHDVDLITTTPINGHVLGFDGTLWVNKTIATWLGFTPVTNARTITINGVSQDLTANRTFTLPFELVVAASDEATALTTGTAKITFRMPRAVTLTAVRASLTTAQASGSIFTVDINEGGVSILSTKLTIDNTEKTSTTAATPPVISDTALADDAEITIDIDQIGDGTAKGLKVMLIGNYA